MPSDVSVDLSENSAKDRASPDSSKRRKSVQFDNLKLNLGN